MSAPHAALSVMVADSFAAAATPLFEAGLVDALLWSPDAAFGRELPKWCEALLDHYAGAGRLTAHGVSLSPLSARFTDRQSEWLRSLAKEMKRRRYVRMSEHVGFMTAGAFERGAPMPAPPCTGAIAAARASLDRLRDASGLAAGLENLALAFCAGDIDAQPGFLALGDFAVLDLHNLHCAAVNFGRDPRALLAVMPLDRVKEIHLAGGRWSYPASDPERRAFRRDTHDGAVPERVFELLGDALAHCPNVEMVVLEALPNSLESEPARERFRSDYRAMRETIAAARVARALPPAEPRSTPFEASAAALDAYQRALLAALRASRDPDSVRSMLLADRSLSSFQPYLRDVEPRTLEIAVELAAMWGGPTVQEAG